MRGTGNQSEMEQSQAFFAPESSEAAGSKADLHSRGFRGSINICRGPHTARDAKQAIVELFYGCLEA
jgi:hypothetical protein